MRQKKNKKVPVHKSGRDFLNGLVKLPASGGQQGYQ